MAPKKKISDELARNRRESREAMQAAMIAAAADIGRRIIDLYFPAPRSAHDESVDYSIGAQFVAPQGVKTAARQLDPPGMVNLTKDPITGEWK
jgi:hypothetical protein